jgi:hypothetical protein
MANIVITSTWTKIPRPASRSPRMAATITLAGRRAGDGMW